MLKIIVSKHSYLIGLIYMHIFLHFFLSIADVSVAKYSDFSRHLYFFTI